MKKLIAILTIALASAGSAAPNVPYSIPGPRQPLPPRVPYSVPATPTAPGPRVPYSIPGPAQPLPPRVPYSI